MASRGTLFPPPNLENLGDMMANEVMYAFNADLVDQLVATIYNVTSRTSGTVAAFARAVKAGTTNIGPELVEVHRQIALDAQLAIITAYTDSLEGTGAYRTDPVHAVNRRYAGGMLLAALRDGNFCQYDERGVYIGNTETLDAVARQWRRLNYGAGAAAGGGAETFTVRWSNLDVFVLSEPGSARPGFMLPAGRWIGSEFYPDSELHAGMLSDSVRGKYGEAGRPRSHPATPTRGIKGKHWMAAGLRVLAESLGPQYTNLFKKLWDEGDEAAKASLMSGTGRVQPGRAKSTVS